MTAAISLLIFYVAFTVQLKVMNDIRSCVDNKFVDYYCYGLLPLVSDLIAVFLFFFFLYDSLLSFRFFFFALLQNLPIWEVTYDRIN